jgi:N6-L-threonylcarbamoyladenine synthase
VLKEAGKRTEDLQGIGYTEGPGLAGALLVGASFARGLAYALGIPAIGVHHLEGHLLSPLLSERAPRFPFVALLVSGGHTQLMRVAGVGKYALLGETQDDAAGEAFDKTAKLLGLGYPAARPRAARAEGRARPLPAAAADARERQPRLQLLRLKTAVLTLVKGERSGARRHRARLRRRDRRGAGREVPARARYDGLDRLIVAGGVGANRQLREALDAQAKRAALRGLLPGAALCTDNGAMIALTAALKMTAAPARQRFHCEAALGSGGVASSRRASTRCRRRGAGCCPCGARRAARP